MTEKYDLLIVGAGPAGMHAAIQARVHGLRVLVVDDQPAPGGQIWRGVERSAGKATGAILGEDYQAGVPVVRDFRACGADYRPGTQVWQIEAGWRVYMTHERKASVVQAHNVLLATGAQERPAPFPGWTLPGVMTVGAAQILLKTSGQVPDQPVWIAGSGPLALVYIKQLLQAGGRVAGWLDTAPEQNWRRGLPYCLSALGSWRELRKGYRWMQALRQANVAIYRGVTYIRAEGDGCLSQLVFQSAGGGQQCVPARQLLVHEGIVPSIHMTRALECRLDWQPNQHCFSPQTDKWGHASRAGVFIAGDGAGIAGARAACLRGRLAALGVARYMGRLDDAQADSLAFPIRRQLARELALRQLLEAMYPPRANVASPSDDTIVCRCEELTAGDIRAYAGQGQPGPNQLKSFTRAGMGPCQGRQCGYTITNILAEAQQRSVEQVGFYRIRPPLKPLTLGEMASMDDEIMQP